MRPVAACWLTPLEHPSPGSAISLEPRYAGDRRRRSTASTCDMRMGRFDGQVPLPCAASSCAISSRARWGSLFDAWITSGECITVLSVAAARARAVGLGALQTIGPWSAALATESPDPGRIASLQSGGAGKSSRQTVWGVERMSRPPVGRAETTSASAKHRAARRDGNSCHSDA